jgi:hypothetical protein
VKKLEYLKDRELVLVLATFSCCKRLNNFENFQSSCRLTIDMCLCEEAGYMEDK